MQEQLVSFIVSHWQLSGAFVFILTLLVLNEWYMAKIGPKSLSPIELVKAMNNDSLTVIDIRPEEAYKTGHILGAIRLSESNLEKFDVYKEKPFALVCAKGLQAGSLAAKLRKKGFQQIMLLQGGMSAWQAAQLPVTLKKK